MSKKLIAIIFICCFFSFLNINAQETRQTNYNRYGKKNLILSSSLGFGTDNTYKRGNAVIPLPVETISLDLVVFHKNNISLTAGSGLISSASFNKDFFYNEIGLFASSKIYYETSLKGLYFYTGVHLGTFFNSLDSYNSPQLYFDVAMLGIHKLFKNNLGVFFDVNPVSLIPSDKISMGYTSFKLGISYRFKL